MTIDAAPWIDASEVPTRPGRIVHILIGKANPESQNGVNKIVNNLALAQRFLGFDVEVWGITHSADIRSHSPDYPLRLFARARYLPWLSPPLKDALDKLPQGTIVQFHSVFIPEYVAIARRLLRRNIHWIMTPHGGYSPRSMRHHAWRKWIFIWLFERRLLSNAAGIHATGRAEVADAMSLAPKSRVVLIPNGQHLSELEHSHTPVERPDVPVFGFCGRLAMQHKGLDLLLEGFRKFLDGGAAAELWLIGDGSDRPALEKLSADLGTQAQVKFLGPLFGNGKLNRLAALDAFIHTSRWEGFPMSVLEAAGLGLPLLVSQPTNFGEYVKKWACGEVLTDNDPPHIASALKRLADLRATGGLSKLGDQAKAMIQSEFDWHRIAERLAKELYAGASSE